MFQKKNGIYESKLQRVSLTLFFLLALGFYANRGLEAAGLTTGFGEVTLENLEIGKTYTTKKALNLPLAVVNTGKTALDLKVEPVLPATPASAGGAPSEGGKDSELKEGYEPIPSLSWIKLEKAEFREIKPNDSAVTDVIISIPNDKKYLGKKYQVFIWSHTVGGSIGIGLKSKLLLTIKGA